MRIKAIKIEYTYEDDEGVEKKASHVYGDDKHHIDNFAQSMLHAPPPGTDPLLFPQDAYNFSLSFRTVPQRKK